MKNLINNTIQTQVFQENKAIFEAWKYELSSGEVINFPSRDLHLSNSKSYAEEFSVIDHPNISVPTLYNIT